MGAVGVGPPLQMGVEGVAVALPWVQLKMLKVLEGLPTGRWRVSLPTLETRVA